MFGGATLAAKRMYECQASTHGEAILAEKLDAHGEAAYERFANTLRSHACDEIKCTRRSGV